MIIHNVEQNTPEWDALRLGKFTASSCADLLMDEKNKGYMDLIAKISEERFTGLPCESKKWQGNKFTDEGHRREPESRNDYEFTTFNKIDLVGFVELDSWVGCSPDGLIDKPGMVQLKNPIFATQKGYLELVEKLKDLTPNEIMYKLDSKYYKQMQFELRVCKREWNDFYSYHPKLKPVLIKVQRDEEIIQQIKDKLEIAKQQVNQIISKLEQK